MARQTLLGSTIAALLTLISVLGASGGPFPIFYVWPDASPPCNGTLQACIDAASPEDGVDIATNGPIDEEISFAKSLDLRAAPGFQPVFAPGRSILARSALTGADQAIRVQGLTLAGGQIEVSNHNNAGSLIAKVLDNTILTSAYNPPIQLGAQSGGPLLFEIAGNTLTPKAGITRGINISVYSGFASGEVSGNVVTMVPDLSATAIDLYVQSGSLVVDVVGNRISGSTYENGIRLREYLTGTLNARVLGNLVKNAVAGAGITISGYDGPIDLTIVNNTIDASAYGIAFDGFSPEYAGVVANNALTNSGVIAVRDDVPSGVAVLSLRNNLYYGNGADLDTGLTADPASVFANPLYAGPADFHPLPGSPAIGAGDPAAVPPEFSEDLDGNPRKTGASVDIGAYQVPEAAKGLGAASAALAISVLARRRMAV